jgi:hypothetical protein
MRLHEAGRRAGLIPSLSLLESKKASALDLVAMTGKSPGFLLGTLKTPWHLWV